MKHLLVRNDHNLHRFSQKNTHKLHGKLRKHGMGVLDILAQEAIRQGADKINANLSDEAIKGLAAASPGILSGLFKLGKSGVEKAKELFTGNKPAPALAPASEPPRMSIKPVSQVAVSQAPVIQAPVMQAPVSQVPARRRGGSAHMPMPHQLDMMSNLMGMNEMKKVSPIAELRKNAIRITHKNKKKSGHSSMMKSSKHKKNLKQVLGELARSMVHEMH